jgi:hypothetical protein
VVDQAVPVTRIEISTFVSVLMSVLAVAVEEAIVRRYAPHAAYLVNGAGVTLLNRLVAA